MAASRISTLAFDVVSILAIISLEFPIEFISAVLFPLMLALLIVVKELRFFYTFSVSVAVVLVSR